MNAEQKYDLITRDLQEVNGKESLIKILKQRDLKLYWGTAPTGKIHIGYMVPMLKMVDYMKAGCHITILFADLHAYLDSMKSTLEKIEARCEYYQQCIKAILTTLDVDCSKIRFIKGTEFQLSAKYSMDVYKFHSVVSVNTAKHAGAEVVKQSDNPMMTSLLYPGLQALDEIYLDVDAQHGGVDQRKIFMYANDVLPKLGYKQSIHLMNKMASGLRTDARGDNEGKMSASVANSKIDIMDSDAAIKKKIASTYCKPGVVDDNCILDLLRDILFPYLKHRNKPFIIDRKEAYGGPLMYLAVDDVVNDFAALKLHPADLKNGVTACISMMLDPIRSMLNNDEMKTLISKAYDEV